MVKTWFHIITWVWHGTVTICVGGGSYPQSSRKIGVHLASSQILGDVHTVKKNGGCKLQTARKKKNTYLWVDV